MSVLIEIWVTARKPHRVLGDEALEYRTVIAAPVVVQVIVALAVVLTAGEFVGVGGVDVEDRSVAIAEGFVFVLGLDGPAAVGQRLGGPRGVGQVAERTAAARLGSLEALVNVGPGQHGGDDRVAAGKFLHRIEAVPSAPLRAGS